RVEDLAVVAVDVVEYERLIGLRESLRGAATEREAGESRNPERRLEPDLPHVESVIVLIQEARLAVFMSDPGALHAEVPAASKERHEPEPRAHVRPEAGAHVVRGNRHPARRRPADIRGDVVVHIAHRELVSAEAEPSVGIEVRMSGW